MTVGFACVFPNEELRLSRVCTQGGIGTARLFPANLLPVDFLSSAKPTPMSESRLLLKHSGFPILCSFPVDRKVLLFPVYILDFMYVFRFLSTRGDSRVLTLIPCVELDHLGASPFIQGPANLFVPAALASLQRCLSAGVPLRWFSA